jgi:hypothetical protein
MIGIIVADVMTVSGVAFSAVTRENTSRRDQQGENGYKIKDNSHSIPILLIKLKVGWFAFWPA